MTQRGKGEQAAPKDGSSTATVVVLGGMAVLGVLLAGGVLVFAITSPGAGESPAPPSPVMLPVIGGVFALFGLPLVWLALHTFAKDGRIAKWPRAPGAVLSARLASASHSGRDKDGYNRRYTTYTPEVRYRYTVGGRDYEGSAVARSVDATTNREAVAACVARYAAGTAVEVLYDPQDPSTAYLEVRRSVGAMVLLGFGALLAGIGLLLVVLFFS